MCHIIFWHFPSVSSSNNNEPRLFLFWLFKWSRLNPILDAIGQMGFVQTWRVNNLAATQFVQDNLLLETESPDLNVGLRTTISYLATFLLRIFHSLLGDQFDEAGPLALFCNGVTMDPPLQGSKMLRSKAQGTIFSQKQLRIRTNFIPFPFFVHLNFEGIRLL